MILLRKEYILVEIIWKNKVEIVNKKEKYIY